MANTATKIDWDCAATKKHIKEAKAVGLTLIGVGSSRHHRTYQFLECGHSQEIALAHVRDERFICNTCEETSLDHPSNVYLLKIKTAELTWLKVGYAKNVVSRVRGYTLVKEASYRTIKTIKFTQGRDARDFENMVHNKYRKKKLLRQRMRKYHLREGYNECYPMRMLDTLMQELEAKEKELKR